MALIVCVVEGQGDVFSVPWIVKRIAAQSGRFDVAVPRPIRVQRYKVVREGELERAVELAARDMLKPGGILVLLDADDDLPCDLAPRLAERARTARADVPSAVVLARCEKEAWFIGAIESLRGFRGVPESAVAPQDPESIRGAKEWLVRLRGQPYSEVTDQAALANRFDLNAAELSCPSFAKLKKEVNRLLDALSATPSQVSGGAESV
jgi:hypothetical protein